jgi:hypothetical protein
MLHKEFDNTHENNTTKKDDEKQIAGDKKKIILESLQGIIKSIENMPKYAMNTAITHYDYLSLVLLFEAFVQEDLEEV